LQDGGSVGFLFFPMMFPWSSHCISINGLSTCSSSSQCVPTCSQ
jgi:hypothetical protein